MSIRLEESSRRGPFKRNERLEALLRSLNISLECANEKILESIETDATRYPLIFVMGPLRSGTTLLMQVLASTGSIAYPSNLLSRFYGAPLVGAKIQQLLTDPIYNFRNEILDFNTEPKFKSENGKTEGALAPNEFWYFWRRFLPFREIDWLPDKELHDAVDTDALVKELVALTMIFGKPFALKSMILNYNIGFLDALFESAVFVRLKRDPVSNVASILGARRRQLGSESSWYSFKIPEYPELMDLDPITQAAGQLHFINSAVERGLQGVCDSRKFVVNYEDLCRNPGAVMKALFRKLNLAECPYGGPDKFSTSEVRPGEREDIEAALNAFANAGI